MELIWLLLQWYLPSEGMFAEDHSLDVEKKTLNAVSLKHNGTWLVFECVRSNVY